MEFVLQMWGGVFFLMNKVCFWQAERNKLKTRWWRIVGWTVYLIGLPAWIIIFATWRNWIAMSLEASGAPAMLLGLFVAIRGRGKKPDWLDKLAIGGIVVGLSLSLYDFGGLTEVTQYIELALAGGYLVGTYLLANEDQRGYLGYMVMNTAAGILMLVQGYPWLFGQQVASLAFVVDAYRRAQQNTNGETK